MRGSIAAATQPQCHFFLRWEDGTGQGDGSLGGSVYARYRDSDH